MLVSVVIPTSDRGEYLRHCLAVALRISTPDVEIVVSDNASTDDTKDIIQSANSSRVRHIETGRRVSMRQNFEYALEESKGEYVVFIGDDDAILPGQFDGLSQILNTQAPDALSWAAPLFVWPNPDNGGKSRGFRMVKNRAFGLPEQIDVQERRHVMRVGALHKFQPAPGIYHACMSRSFIKDKLAGADGTCFLARSPDTYMAMRALQVGGNFMHCRHPFSMHGRGAKSTGGSYASFGRNKRNDAPSTETRFEREVKTDAVKDAIPIAKSVNIDFLSTLETIKGHFPDPKMEVDYLSWYRTILNELAKKNAATKESVLQIMADYAVVNGTEQVLERALKSPQVSLVQAKMAWHKNMDKLGSYRVAGGDAGFDTVDAAAAACDFILGTDFEQVLSGQIKHQTAWANAKKRFQSSQFGS
ncbi:MAG: glycosyltransferase family 2 protein [Roseobacter sp.]